MRKLDISPEAYNDLDSEFGEKEEKKRLRAIINDLKRLQKYPETDIKLFERLGMNNINMIELLFSTLNNASLFTLKGTICA